MLLNVLYPRCHHSKTICCSRQDCGQVSVYGKHFDNTQWEKWTDANDTENGTCEFCGLTMKPAKGIPKQKRLQFHILRRCPKYRQQCDADLGQSSPALPRPPSGRAAAPQPPRPSTSTTATVRPQPLTSQLEERERADMERARLKPKPIACKKKKGNIHVFSCLQCNIFC